MKHAGSKEDVCRRPEREQKKTEQRKEFNSNNEENHSRNSLCFHGQYHSPCLNMKPHQHIITQTAFLPRLSLSISHALKQRHTPHSAYHRMTRSLFQTEKLVGEGAQCPPVPLSPPVVWKNVRIWRVVKTNSSNIFKKSKFWSL